jgi:hypothetical protein
MRSFPLVVIAGLLCGLATASAWAQQLQCEPCRHGFNKVQIGSSSTFLFQLSNTGSKTLTITAMSIQGSAFSFGKFPLPAHIQPSASVKLPVIFTPTALGYTFGTIELVSTAKDSPLQLYTSGHGIDNANPQLTVSPSTLNFGSVTVGSAAVLQAALTASNASVTISSDESTSAEFVVLGLDLPVTIAAGQSLPVSIQFTPSATGKSIGKVSFISNAEDSPTLEHVTGVGAAPSSHSVDLSWDPGDGNAVGYNIYRGTAQAGPYQKINSALEASTNYTDYAVELGQTYYYVTTEVNGQGEESGYSNVAEAQIPDN